MEKFDAKELEGALIFVSCETTYIDDAEEIYERNFPFTFRGNHLVCFEVSPEDVDEEFDMSEYDEEHRGTYDVEAYSSLQELADKILTVEGEEYVKAFYYDEELVVDNKFTFTLFNEQREAIFTYSKVVDVQISKREEQQEEEEAESEVTLDERRRKSLDITLKVHDDKFIYDRRIVLFHLFLLAITTGAVWLYGYFKGWTTYGLSLVPITSGLYFTQWWWSNAKREHLGVFERATRRAKGRPWINGGFIVGLVAVLLNLIYYHKHPEQEPIDYYLMWWMITLLTTLIWGFIVLAHRYQNKSVADEFIDATAGSIRRTTRRLGRRQFIRDFFLAMLPWKWEMAIRNRHIERLDSEE